ncbi:hypothetical protein V1520DRAFT_349502 [Lipomyces starkeyi]
MHMKDVTERSTVLVVPLPVIPRPYSGTQVRRLNYLASNFGRNRYLMSVSAKGIFECHGELEISFSQANAFATVIYEHIGHTESRKFHMTDEVRNYITSEQDGYGLVEDLQEPGFLWPFLRLVS